jgi:hypothetical protein
MPPEGSGRLPQLFETRKCPELLLLSTLQTIEAQIRIDLLHLLGKRMHEQL